MKLDLPSIVFGSSALGNLYEVVPEATKRSIVENWLKSQPRPVIDSAGKYGAGLALENIGRYLKQLGAAPDQVLLSNKLGWKRVPLTTPEPTFEKGAWFGLEHDAAQHISYQGILECYHQGNELLGDYAAQLVSVHDPDEYLAASKDPEEAARRYEDILGAYRALVELREQGSVRAVGVGSKDWNIIQRLVHDGVSLDWVMLANSFTLYTHHHFWHLETVLEAFGPSRLMFGSDWPVCLLATGYADWLALIRRFIAPLSAHEQSEILAGSARRAYGLSDPKK